MGSPKLHKVEAPSPFAGGIISRGVTKRHQPLVWEAMLGAVSARDPETGKVQYFDYKWEEARAYAKVAECDDLRVATNKNRRGILDTAWPRMSQRALWGIWPKGETK